MAYKALPCGIPPFISAQSENSHQSMHVIYNFHRVGVPPGKGEQVQQNNIKTKKTM